MSKITATIAFPFVLCVGYYMVVTLWAIIAALATWDISVFVSMWFFWTQVDNAGIVLARAFSWIIAFGAGCSLFFMEK